MAQMRKNNITKRQREPLRPSEHMGNVVHLIRIAHKIDDVCVKVNNLELVSKDENRLTYADLNALALLHRLTFYGKFLEVDTDLLEIRLLVERIISSSLIDVATWEGRVEKNAEVILAQPINIHWKHKEKLIKFIANYCEALVNTSDRKKYAMCCYHGLLECLIYYKLKEDDGLQISKFVDKNDDKKSLEAFSSIARSYNVLQVRTLR